MNQEEIQQLPVSPCALGESPVWHPTEQMLYWCDIVGRRLHRFSPQQQSHEHWAMPADIACCAFSVSGGLLLARRDGIWHFDPEQGASTQIIAPPFDTKLERFNDGKVGPDGAFWVGTIYEPRDQAKAKLYRWARGSLQQIASGVTVSNGLAWSPDGRTMYWSDTWGHVHYAMDFDPAIGRAGQPRVFKAFDKRLPSAPLDSYQGRPDGATVDAEGCLWVAMFEGSRLLRLSPKGEVLHTLHLPVRCPTMPCFGGSDLRTLFITTAREGRSPEELASMPLSGCVLHLRVEVPGLSTNLAH